jgi:prepilin-type processing-associated H-X9-DG protein
MPVWGWLLIGCGCIGVGGFGFFGVLAAILFPVFSQSREKARMAKCLSNVKQMGLALSMYIQDYDEQFPPGSRWMDATFPYVKREDVYRCPSVAGANATAPGYAFNSQVSLKKLERISNPATVRAIFESTKFSRNATDPLTSLPSPGRHSRGNNFGYADGHAKWELSTSAGSSPPDPGP